MKNNSARKNNPQNRIPVHKDGKKLCFLRSEIDRWLSSGRIKTKDEIGILSIKTANHSSGIGRAVLHFSAGSADAIMPRTKNLYKYFLISAN